MDSNSSKVTAHQARLKYAQTAFSTNVTPRIVDGSLTSTSSPAPKEPIFGGPTRATDFKETKIEIPDDALINLPLSSAAHNFVETLCRPSFAADDEQNRRPGHLTALQATGSSSMMTLRVDTSTTTNTSTLGSKHTPPPAIPDELKAALARSPGIPLSSFSFMQSSPSPHAPSPSAKSMTLNSKSLDIDARVKSNNRNLANSKDSAPSPYGSASSSPSPSSSSSPPPPALSSPRIKEQTSKSSLRRRALLEAKLANGEAPSTPNIIPATPSPVSSPLLASPSLSSPGSRSLRKAASAESLRTRYRTQSIPKNSSNAFNPSVIGDPSAGLGITVLERNALPPSSQFSTKGTIIAPTTTSWQQSRADMKSIWKNFSSKLHIRPVTNKNDREALAAPPLNSITMGRKSMESAVRHSLSIYPRRSNERRLSSSSTASRSSNNDGGGAKTQQGGRGFASTLWPGRAAEMLIGPGKMHANASASSSLSGKDVTTEKGKSKAKSTTNILITSPSRTSIELMWREQVDTGMSESEWALQECFTHDLSQRRKRGTKSNVRSSIGSMAGRTTPKPARKAEGSTVTHGIVKPVSESRAESAATAVEDSEDGNDDREDEEEEEDIESDLASQLSYVDSSDLPMNDSSPAINLPEKQETITVSPTIMARSGTVRRATNPATFPSSGMAAGIQRNRSNSHLKLPASIDTSSSTLHPDRNVAPTAATTATDDDNSALTPQEVNSASTVYMDAVSSPISQPSAASPPVTAILRPPIMSPTSTAAPNRLDPDHSGPNAIIDSALSPISPAGSMQTVRPRSMSESCISTPVPNEARTQRNLVIHHHNNDDNINKRLSNDRKEEASDEQSNDHLRHGHDSSLTAHNGKRGKGKSNAANSAPSAELESGRQSGDTSSSDLLNKSTSSRKSGVDYVIAVVGPRNVGKSTIIEQNLKLPKDKSTLLFEDDDANKVLSYTGVFSVTGRSCTIEVLEVDMQVLKSSSEGLLWPRNLPKPDGVMICYKYSDTKGTDHLKTLLHGFWTRGGVHMIALATQCPIPQANSPPYKAEGDRAAEICNIHGAGLVHLDGGIEDPNRKARNSLSWILSKILDVRAQSSRSPSRAKRQIAMKRSTATLLGDKTSGAIPTELATPVPEETSNNTLSIDTPSKTTDSLQGDSSLSTLLSSQSKHSQLDIYLSKEDIMQKFLFAGVTGNDDEHIATFLTVFRRFDTPHSLLLGIIERFETLSRHMIADPLLSQYAQMRLAGLLCKWMELHTNDFTGSATSEKLKNFVATMHSSPWLLHHAMEIDALFVAGQATVDQDYLWTLPDVNNGEHADTKSTGLQASPVERRPSLVPSMTSTLSTISDQDSSQASLAPSTPGTPSFLTGSDGRIAVTGDQLSHPLPSGKKSVLHPRRARSYSDTGTTGSSELSSGNASYPSTRSKQNIRRHNILIEVSNKLLECNVQPLARQITKHAWNIFSCMQPRDLLRYVMTPRDPNNPEAPPLRSEENPVTKAVAFSNYLSNWTASLILVQPKQKMRGRLLEHLISLALALRGLDNFECLMAVLVGLNSAPVHRLDDLVQFVSEDLYKKFRSMNRLMATSRSFSAYRLAVTNARPDMIPYLGIHLQDITRVHDGKSDMRDGLVNWSKMRQIGRFASIVVDCARLAPQNVHDEALSRLIVDLPVYSLNDDDDSLYDLSYSYKPRQKRSASNSQTAKLKRLLREAISPPGGLPSLGGHTMI